VEEEMEGEEEGGACLESPFVIKKRQKRSSPGLRKKKKPDKAKGMMSLALREVDLDEIRDVVYDAMMDLMSQFEAQYQQTLGKVQQGLQELHVQTSLIQVSVGYVSRKQVILNQASMSAFEIENYINSILSKQEKHSGLLPYDSKKNYLSQRNNVVSRRGPAW